MPYYIKNTSGQTTYTVPDNSAGSNPQLSVDLLGQNFVGYGDEMATTLLHMLENFSNNAAPTNPIEGQLWYKRDNGTLNIYNGSAFIEIGAEAGTVATAQPAFPSIGDLWYDETTLTLKIWNG